MGANLYFLRKIGILALLILICIFGIFISDNLTKSDNTDFATVAAEYAKFMRSSKLRSIVSYPEYLRYEYVKINNDEIPELLIATGNGHGDQIFVFTYVCRTHNIHFCGSYFSMGQMECYEKTSVVSGQIGGSGLWFKPYIYFNEEWQPELIAASGINGNNGDCFWVEGNGSAFKGDVFVEDYFKREYIVPIDKMVEAEHSLICSLDTQIDIDYDNMVPYTK